jgi:hypothetical protein
VFLRGNNRNHLNGFSDGTINTALKRGVNVIFTRSSRAYQLGEPSASYREC